MTMYLVNGASSQCGIYLAGKNESAAYASYAYRQDGQLQCKTGPQNDVMALFKQHHQTGHAESNGYGKVALMVIVPVALIEAAFLLAQNIFQIAGVAAFAVIAAFPCYALSLIGENNFASDALFQQFRRHHGAEHKLFAYYRKIGERAQAPIEAHDLQDFGYIDRECGTVLMASVVLWAAALGVAIALVPAWGAMGSFGFVIVVTVVLILNIYKNPINPLLSIQKPEVAPPTLAELEVAATAYNALLAAFDR